MGSSSSSARVVSEYSALVVQSSIHYVSCMENREILIDSSISVGSSTTLYFRHSNLFASIG